MDALARGQQIAVDPHQPLRDDVRLLGELLGRVLREHGRDGLFDRVEQVRALAKSARDDDEDFDRLADLLGEMPIESALPRFAKPRAAATRTSKCLSVIAHSSSETT